MTISYTDPRYQRALLDAQAKKGMGALVNTPGITSDFAQQQQDVHNQFAQLGLRKYLFEKEMLLNEKKLAFDSRYFNKKMSNMEDELTYGLIGGLGTGIVASLEGRRRRLEKEKTARMIK